MTKRTWLKLALVAGGGYLVAKRLAAKPYDFAGKVAIVTGGSRGLGIELARRLGQLGARVAICARDSDELAAAVEDLDRRGVEVFAGPCDVTDRAQVEGFVRAVGARFGRIDVLVNNAGVIEAGPAEEMTEADFDRSIATHFYGPMYFIEAALPFMKRAGGGRIANIASIGGKMTPPHILPYLAGKFALVGYSEGLGVELAKDGIRVTTVCPGLMRTGSMFNASFKGQQRKELAWFAVGSSIPLLTIDSTSAAERIVEAIAWGKREYVFPFAWKGIVTGHDLFRNASLAVMEQVNRLFPAPGGQGTRRSLGREIDSPIARSPITAQNRAAAARNNEWTANPEVVKGHA